jgi:hypothetical protein
MLQKQPSALQREQPALEFMNFLLIFIFVGLIWAFMHPYWILVETTQLNPELEPQH